MKENKTAIILIVLTIIMSTLSLSIVYAAYTQRLNLMGTAKIKGNQWNIKYDSQTLETAKEGTAVIDSTSINEHDFSFKVNLYKPNDSVTYTFNIINAGQIDAKLEKVILTGVSEALAKNVEYNVTWSDDAKIESGDKLNAGEAKKIKVTIKYKSTAPAQNNETIELNLGGTLTYVQA